MPSRSTIWSPGLPKEETCVWRGEFRTVALMDFTLAFVCYSFGIHEHGNAHSLAKVQERKTRPPTVKYSRVRSRLIPVAFSKVVSRSFRAKPRVSWL